MAVPTNGPDRKANELARDLNLYAESVYHSQDYIRGCYNPVPCQNGKWRAVYIPLIPTCWHMDDVNEFWPDKAMASIIAKIRNGKLMNANW